VSSAPSAREPASARSSLLVDLYELTMGEAYVANGIADTPATFELVCRHLPPGWGYFVTAGLAAALDYLERLRFTAGELEYLDGLGLFGSALLDRLTRFRFTGEVRAMPEGTVCFPGEPLLEVTAPMLEAQLVETVVLNELHFQSLVASKAARCVDAAKGKRLVDFGLRRAHGGEAGLKVARASYLAGFDATSNVLAAQAFGIPAAGTMAHSFVECFDDERAAFDAFLRAYPRGSTLLIDTYDTIEGARLAARTALALDGLGVRLGGVRLDSGDLLELSRGVRRILDQAGLAYVTIFASGNLDERELERLLAQNVPIDGFGVGSRLAVSADAPFLDAAYKLVAFDGRPVLKLSEGKATLPGAKQVFRLQHNGRFARDLVALVDESCPPESVPLLEPVMRGGIRLSDEPLEIARRRAAEQRAALAPEHRLVDAQPYTVELSRDLVALRETLTRMRRPVSG
jgi:nicotinate phosphoribosyltransferase